MGGIRESVFVPAAVSHIARRRGCFAAAGIDVRTSAVSSSREQRLALDSGATDVAITAVDNLFAWNAAGSDIAVVAQVETTTDLALMLRPGPAGFDVRDVVRLAVDAPGNGFAVVAYAMLARLGRDLSRCEVVEVGGVRERFAALVEGSVDVALLAPPLDEAGLARGMTVAMRVRELEPSYPGLGVVATRALLASRPGDVAAYLRALDAAVRWMRAAPPDEVRRELASAGVGPSSVRSVLATLPAGLAPGVEGLEVLARLREDLGMRIPGMSAPADLVDDRILRVAVPEP